MNFVGRSLCTLLCTYKSIKVQSNFLRCLLFILYDFEIGAMFKPFGLKLMVEVVNSVNHSLVVTLIPRTCVQLGQ
jgi:hypothetical protein